MVFISLEHCTQDTRDEKISRPAAAWTMARQEWDQLSAATIQKCHGSPTQFRRLLLLQISSYLWQATNVHFFWIKYYENYSSVPPKGRENVKAMKPNSVNQSGVSVLTWNRGSGNKNGDGTLRQIVKCVVLCDKV